MPLSNSHIRRWQGCTLCPLHKFARSYVLGRGTLPADVLFIGEAPGPKEDLLGEPFVGPSGRLFDEIIAAVVRDPIFPERSVAFTYYITNVVACCPWTDRTRDSFREPTKEEALACAPRLVEVANEVRPKTIIYIGQVAKRFHKTKLPTLVITHPSAILRMNVPPQNTVTYHQTIDKIRTHMRSLKK